MNGPPTALASKEFRALLPVWAAAACTCTFFDILSFRLITWPAFTSYDGMSTFFPSTRTRS